MDMGKYSYADNINIGEGQGGISLRGSTGAMDDGGAKREPEATGVGE